MKMREWGDSPIVVRSGFFCEYCGTDLLSHPRLFESLTFDHFRPRSRGGADDLSNRIVCCAACDRWKKSYLPASIADARLLLAEIRLRTMPHLERYRVAFRPFAADVQGGGI